MATVADELPRGDETTAQRVLRLLGKAPLQILLVIIGVLWLVPTLGLFFTSLLSPERFNESGWWQILSEPSLATLDNYDKVFNTDAIVSSLWTTVLVSLGGTILPIFVAAMAAYAFAWLDFPGRDWLFILVIAMLVVPIQMALIPIFKLYSDLNLFDTVIGLILFHTAFGLPFAIFLLRNFFIGIPRDLLEAARIDGASELRIFLRLILPLGLPAIASLAIFQFLWVWNDLLVALVFLSAQGDMSVLTLELSRIVGGRGQQWHLLTAGAFVTMLLPVLVFLALQRYFVRGILSGSVKG